VRDVNRRRTWEEKDRMKREFKITLARTLNLESETKARVGTHVLKPAGSGWERAAEPAEVERKEESESGRTLLIESDVVYTGKLVFSVSCGEKRIGKCEIKLSEVSRESVHKYMYLKAREEGGEVPPKGSLLEVKIEYSARPVRKKGPKEMLIEANRDLRRESLEERTKLFTEIGPSYLKNQDKLREEQVLHDKRLRREEDNRGFEYVANCAFGKHVQNCDSQRSREQNNEILRFPWWGTSDDCGEKKMGTGDYRKKLERARNEHNMEEMIKETLEELNEHYPKEQEYSEKLQWLATGDYCKKLEHALDEAMETESGDHAMNKETLKVLAKNYQNYPKQLLEPLIEHPSTTIEKLRELFNTEELKKETALQFLNAAEQNPNNKGILEFFAAEYSKERGREELQKLMAAGRLKNTSLHMLLNRYHLNSESALIAAVKAGDGDKQQIYKQKIYKWGRIDMDLLEREGADITEQLERAKGEWDGEKRGWSCGDWWAVGFVLLCLSLLFWWPHYRGQVASVLVVGLSGWLLPGFWRFYFGFSLVLSVALLILLEQLNITEADCPQKPICTPTQCHLLVDLGPSSFVRKVTLVVFLLIAMLADLGVCWGGKDTWVFSLMGTEADIVLVTVSIVTHYVAMVAGKLGSVFTAVDSSCAPKIQGNSMPEVLCYIWWITFLRVSCLFLAIAFLFDKELGRQGSQPVLQRTTICCIWESDPKTISTFGDLDDVIGDGKDANVDWEDLCLEAEEGVFGAADELNDRGKEAMDGAKECLRKCFS